MKTFWDENSSRTRISPDWPTDVKRGRWPNRDYQTAMGTISGHILVRSRKVIGNLLCIVAYNN